MVERWYSGTSRKARRRNSRSPLIPPRPGRPARNARRPGRDRGASSRAGLRDQTGHGPGRAPFSPSRSSSRSWNVSRAVLEGRERPHGAGVRLRERGPDEQRTLHGVGAALSLATNASSVSPAVEGLAEGHLRSHPVVAVQSADQGRGRSRGQEESIMRRPRGRRRAAQATCPRARGPTIRVHELDLQVGTRWRVHLAAPGCDP